MLLILTASLLATASCMKTFAGNANSADCVFPFAYKGQIYETCTTIDNENKPWCATTANYDRDRKWGRCDLSTSATITTGGNSGGDPCVFPFTYKGSLYEACTSRDYKREWCATTSNYDKDRKWGNCATYLQISTTGGNSVDNSDCVFPFIYQNKEVSGCLYDAGSGPWCGTTSNYDRDRKWAKCILDQQSAGVCSNTYTKYQNMLSLLGQGVPYAKTQSDCEKECNTRSSCMGYDFNVNADVDVRCFLHDNNNHFRTRADATGIDEYVISNRCAQTCTTQYERYTETLSYGGRQISGATTVEECSNQCDTNPKCVGFDFDINQDQNIRCYTHESFTNYDSRRTAKNVDEYVLTTKTCSNVYTSIGNSPNSTCYFPYVYRGQVYMTCNSRSWAGPWCSTTPNYDADKRWTVCNVNAA